MKIFSFGILLLLIFSSLVPVNSQGLSISTEVCSDCTVNDKDYLLYLPENYDPGSSYRLIIFLHGLQQQTNWNVELLRNKGLMREIGKTNTFLPYKDRYIVIAPFTSEVIWNTRNIREMYDHIISRFPNIDVNAVFVTGLSMGGKGSWDFAIRYPDIVTGIVPLWSNVNVGSYNGSDSTFTLCDLANVAIWTIDGMNDPKMPPYDIKLDRDGSNRWGTAIVTDILRSECAPPLKPINHLWPSKTHNGFDEVYSLSAGFDIYQWIDQLEKNNGIPVTQGIPIVTLPRRMNIPSGSSRWSIKGFAVDPDQQALTYNWTVTPESASMAYLTETREDELILRDYDAGTYTITLEVSDTDGKSSSAETQISVLSDPSGLADIENTVLLSYDAANAGDLMVLGDSTALSFSTIGTDQVNIRSEGNGLVNAIRFGLDEVRDYRTETRQSIGYLGLESNSDFVAQSGEYVLTVTACPDNFCDEPGISRQYILNFSADPLPVTFASMQAERQGRNVVLWWSTATEWNNSHFEVRRWSESSAEKSMVGIVDPNPGSKGFSHYRFTDSDAPNEKLYYQVVNVDHDGGKQYSDIISVNRLMDSQFIWPNPALPGEVVNIHYDEILDVNIYRADGRKVTEGSRELKRFIIPERGLYIINIQTPSGLIRQKLIIR